MKTKLLASLGVLSLALAACSGATPASADAATSDTATSSDTAADTADASDAYTPPQYQCNQVMGVSVTGEWFAGGFEALVDDGHWQAITLSHAYIDLWADPTNTVWATPIVSPCTQGSTDPDRILFTGCNWDFTTAAQWTQAFTAVIQNLQTKYPNVKRIDLLTMLRAPGNKICDSALNNESIVAPYIDEAVTNVAAAFPNLVVVAPKFEAPNCDVFVLGGPHFTPDGAALVAQVFAAYYKQHQ